MLPVFELNFVLSLALFELAFVLAIFELSAKFDESAEDVADLMSSLPVPESLLADMLVVA